MRRTRKNGCVKNASNHKEKQKRDGAHKTMQKIERKAESRANKMKTRLRKKVGVKKEKRDKEQFQTV